MITRCPSCDTHFRVHADQLAARAGQVRCGKCDKVFNAHDHLVEEALPGYEPEAAHQRSLEGERSIVHEPVPARTGTAEMQPQPQPARLEPAVARTEAAATASTFDFGPSAAADSASKPRRWPWLLGSLIMLVVLLGQVAFHYRTAISLLIPETKPWYVELCATLGCELALPRRIELMSIEASDLQADTTNPSVMVLTATLRNRAIFNQQAPLIELTLIDAQEQPVVRRVLAPQDYMGKTVSAQAGFAANSEVAIKVFVEGSQVKATGYRLYLFYP
jgi:predicted Zn finger-like uncharacterized protein